MPPPPKRNHTILIPRVWSNYHQALVLHTQQQVLLDKVGVNMIGMCSEKAARTSVKTLVLSKYMYAKKGNRTPLPTTHTHTHLSLTVSHLPLSQLTHQEVC